MLKRILSLYLCAALVFSLLPAQVFATEEIPEPTESVTEPVEETVAPTEEEPTEEVTEPTEEVTEPTEEETEATEAATEPEEEPEQLSMESLDLDAEELLMGYLSPFYNGEGASFFGTVGRDRLSAANQYLYDGLKAQVVRIAAGLEGSTTIEVDFSGTEYTRADSDFKLVLHAMSLDCPFEMYWYDGCTAWLYTNRIILFMQPNPYYQAENFNEEDPYIDTTKTKQAAAAAENIYNVKTRYEAYGDYDKLCAYADEICALVEYDHYAADNNTHTLNINPWTLINVFDNDPTTNVVCEGYAEAFQYLCDESTFRGDVVCISATGNNHKWNIVRIDGVGYLMDVTHCDDGNVATRGSKFLGGGEGSVADGYVIGGFHYWYDSEYTLPVYGSGEDSALKLSPTKYTPPATYTILYDANGGTGAPNSQKKTQGKDLILRQEIPIWNGYIFQGWATTSTATAAEYQPGDVYSAEGDAVLYAVWEQINCTHNFGDYQVTESATCEKAGTEQRTCTLCGAAESREIPAPGHNKVTVPGVAPTCTADGLTEGVKCSVCGEIFTKQEVIPAGHTVVDGVCAVCQVYGTCGDDLTWILDSAGTLKISGTGNMYNYHLSRKPSPWTGMSSIQKVIIEKDVTSIGDYAFHECVNMSSITIPESVADIGMGAFGSCSNLTGIDLPNSITSISGRTFWGCTGLESITIPDGVTEIYAAAFHGCSSLTSVSIPESVAHINLNAFNDCSSLTSITIPNSVESIGDAVFRNCTSLKTITLPDSITSLGDGVFSNCTRLSSVKLPANLTGIGSSVFSGCAIAGIELPDSITSIGTRAFFDCRNLSGIILPEELVTIDQEAFYGCTSLTSVTVPAKLTSIGLGAFEACQNLRDVHIADLAAWATSDLGYAFSSSHGNEIWLYQDEELLTDVVIPDGVTTVGNWAFANCTQIKSVTLPTEIAGIGEYAFLAHEGTTGIDRITFQGDAPVFTENVFTGTTANAYYPVGNPTWTADVMQNYGGTITWVPYGGVKNQITIPASDLNGQTSVWIDGREYAVKTDSGMPYVDLPDSNAKTMVVHSYGVSKGKQYPMSMKVWMLSNEDGFYTATRVKELDDILGYEGCSIRVTGTQGIRMITSLDKADKAALTGEGLAGYTLKEYGTVIAWASQLGSRRPLTLGNSYVSANYAYSREAGTDPVFGTTDSRTQYTNVLVGFNLDQCRNDIAMRPYMILEDASGNEITLYGGIVERSIGYIAAQNAGTFNEETEADAYNYVWNIILHVYGEDYIPE